MAIILSLFLSFSLYYLKKSGNSGKTEKKTSKGKLCPLELSHSILLENPFHKSSRGFKGMGCKAINLERLI